MCFHKWVLNIYFFISVNISKLYHVFINFRNSELTTQGHFHTVENRNSFEKVNTKQKELQNKLTNLPLINCKQKLHLIKQGKWRAEIMYKTVVYWSICDTYESAMVTSTSTPGSMLMEVICLTISDGLCRSMTRLCTRIWNLSQVLEPSPQGVLRVVMRRILVGILTGPLTRRFCFLAPLIKSAQTATRQCWK